MIKTLVVATAAAGILCGAAQAHGYGHDRADLPPPPYAQDGRTYTSYERAPSKGFPLVGADAGVTVLGLHLGGSAKIRLGVDEELREKRYRRVKVKVDAAAPARAEAPPPPPCCERGRW